MGISVDDSGSSREHAETIEGIARSGRFLMALFFVLAAFFGASAAFFACLSVFDAVSSGFSAGFHDGLFLSLGLGIHALVLFTAGLIFRDVSRYESPFSIKQARRIRIIAWLLLVYSVVESFVPDGAAISSTPADTTLMARQVDEPVASIQIGSIVIAIVFFFLSAVFRYGVKLQELSDDTV